MKQSKNKPSVTNVVINSIKALNLENGGKNIAYSTQGRVLKDKCYSFTNGLRYLNGAYNQAFAEWNILKEDSKGDESTSVAIQEKEGYLHDLESQADDFQELKDLAYEAHLELFKTHYVLPIKGSKMVSTRQEIDSNWTPKKR